MKAVVEYGDRDVFNTRTHEAPTLLVDCEGYFLTVTSFDEKGKVIGKALYNSFVSVDLDMAAA